MIRRELTITNRLGLHARATAKLVQLLSGFPCQATLEARGREVNAKSIMGVMMLAAGMGAEIEIETDGLQEQEAMDALLAMIDDKFGEGK